MSAALFIKLILSILRVTLTTAFFKDIFQILITQFVYDWRQCTCIGIGSDLSGCIFVLSCLWRLTLCLRFVDCCAVRPRWICIKCCLGFVAIRAQYEVVIFIAIIVIIILCLVCYWHVVTTAGHWALRWLIELWFGLVFVCLFTFGDAWLDVAAAWRECHSFVLKWIIVWFISERVKLSLIIWYQRWLDIVKLVFGRCWLITE